MTEHKAWNLERHDSTIDQDEEVTSGLLSFAKSKAGASFCDIGSPCAAFCQDRLNLV